MIRKREQCGGPIPDHMRVSAMFCSKRCANDRFNVLDKAARLEVRRARPPCAACGAPIPVERPDRTRFCSSACC